MDDYLQEDDNQFIGGAVGLLSYDFTSSNCNVLLNSEKILMYTMLILEYISK